MNLHVSALCNSPLSCCSLERHGRLPRSRMSAALRTQRYSHVRLGGFISASAQVSDDNGVKQDAVADSSSRAHHSSSASRSRSASEHVTTPAHQYAHKHKPADASSGRSDSLHAPGLPTDSYKVDLAQTPPTEPSSLPITPSTDIADSPPVDRSSVTRAELFPSQHVDHWSPQMLLYLPFGCAVAAIRMALWVILLAVDSPLLTDNQFMINVLYGVLGIRVRWHGTHHLPSERHVVVSNHVTVGDLMVLYSRPQSYVHLITSRLPKRITQATHHRVKLRHASSDTYSSLKDSAAHPESVHLFPEGGMTSGKGMMKFSRGFMRFGRDLPIVPAAMRAQSSFGISTHTLSSSFLANMFWFCFSPTMTLDVTVLPPMFPEEGEGNGKFVERVQAAIGSELDVPTTDVTLSQKHMRH